MAKQTDKRVLRTKERIKTAFMQLMLENEPENISISQITKKAAVNRSTFYLHYRDVPSIIDEIDGEFAKEISQSIDDFNLSDMYGSIYKMFSNLTSALTNNEVMRAYIIYSSDAMNIAMRLKNIIVEKALAAISEAHPTVNKTEITYPLTFTTAGIVDCYIKWVKEDAENKTLDSLIRQVSLYTEYIIKRIT